MTKQSADKGALLLCLNMIMFQSKRFTQKSPYVNLNKLNAISIFNAKVQFGTKFRWEEKCLAISSAVYGQLKMKKKKQCNSS